MKNHELHGAAGHPGGQGRPRSTSRSSRTPRRQAQDVLANKVDWLQDPPPPDQLRELRSQTTGPLQGVRHELDVLLLPEPRRMPPFDDPKVRQAVAYADRRARAGAPLRRPARARPATSCRRAWPATRRSTPARGATRTPRRTSQKAKALITGSRRRRRGGHRLRQRRGPVDPGHRVPRRPAQPDRAKAKPRIVEGSSLLPDDRQPEDEGPDRLRQLVPGLPGTRRTSCSSSTARRSSRRTTRTSATSTIPEINKLIKTANENPDVDDAADDYAAVDKKLVENAYVLPYGNRKLTKITSERIAFDGLLFHPGVLRRPDHAGPQGDSPHGRSAGQRPAPRPGSASPAGAPPTVVAAADAAGAPRPARSAAARSRWSRSSPCVLIAGRELRSLRRCGPSTSRTPGRSPTTSPTRSRSTARRSTSCRYDGVPIGPTYHGQYFLGADGSGRDVMVRLLYGGPQLAVHRARRDALLACSSARRSAWSPASTAAGPTRSSRAGSTSSGRLP